MAKLFMWLELVTPSLIGISSVLNNKAPTIRYPLYLGLGLRISKLKAPSHEISRKAQSLTCSLAKLIVNLHNPSNVISIRVF